MLSELILRMLARLHRDERGQDTAEYLVMTGVVAAIIIGVIYTAYSGALQSLVGDLATALTGIIP